MESIRFGVYPPQLRMSYAEILGGATGGDERRCMMRSWMFVLLALAGLAVRRGSSTPPRSTLLTSRLRMKHIGPVTGSKSEYGH